MVDKKRLTAHKACLKEINEGKYVKNEGFEPNYAITDLGRKLSRVRVFGTIMNKFTNDENSYAFIVIDDGTDNLRMKVWQNVSIFDDFETGDMVDCVARVKKYEDEMYLTPETVTKMEPKQEVLRKAELALIWHNQKDKLSKVKEAMNKIADAEELEAFVKEKHKIDPEEVGYLLRAVDNTDEEKEESSEEKKSYKNKILKIIEELDGGEGVEIAKILKESKLPENVVDATINELLTEGSIYEPRAGKLRKL